MPYRKIEPKLWDDEKIARVDPITKLVWLYVLTGPHTTALAGLWHVGTAQIAEGSRLPFQDVESALYELERLGRIVRHRACRMLCVPNAPKHNAAANADALKSWFRIWADLPQCALKLQHIQRLRSGVSAKLDGAWLSTFGSVDASQGGMVCGAPAIASEQGALFQSKIDTTPVVAAVVGVSTTRRNPSPATAPDPVDLDLDPDPTRAKSKTPAEAILEALSIGLVLRQVANPEFARKLAAYADDEGFAPHKPRTIDVIAGLKKLDGMLDDEQAASRETVGPKEIGRRAVGFARNAARGEADRPTSARSGVGGRGGPRATSRHDWVQPDPEDERIWTPAKPLTEPLGGTGTGT